MMKVFLPFLFVMFLSGCTTMQIEDFEAGQPELNLFEYFEGETRAWGLFEDRFGTVRRQFQVDITGEVRNGELILDESFLYDDGEKDKRIWHIRYDSEGVYKGRADDIIGEAEGRVAGNALNWVYVMNLKVGDSSWRVNFDDWMFLQSDGVMINRAVVKKFGFELGTVTLFFKK